MHRSVIERRSCMVVFPLTHLVPEGLALVAPERSGGGSQARATGTGSWPLALTVGLVFIGSRSLRKEIA